jgi:ankyrin repeat protein
MTSLAVYRGGFPKQGDTPLHWIPSNGSAASVKLLLDRGADLNAENSVGKLIICLYDAQTKFVIFELQRRYTPILLAALRHNAVAASVLLKAGAITNIRTVTFTW